MHPVAHNKWKEPIVPDNIDTPIDDELSSGNSPSSSLLPTKNAQESTKTRSRKRPLPHPAFSDVVNGPSRMAMREVGIRQNWPDQALRNPPMLPSGLMPPMPPGHPAFSAAPTLYMSSTTLIWRLDHMLSSPLGKHILNYEPPCEFVIPAFTMFDGSVDPYNHMLHYNQAMTLNAGNDRVLCKVFLASLWGLALVWLNKLSRYIINLFNELWAAIVSQYLCSVRQKRNISSL